MFEGRRPDSNEVWAIDADAYVVRRLVDGLEAARLDHRRGGGPPHPHAVTRVS